jgi:hypothetical protein
MKILAEFQKNFFHPIRLKGNNQEQWGAKPMEAQALLQSKNVPYRFFEGHGLPKFQMGG